MYMAFVEHFRFVTPSPGVSRSDAGMGCSFSRDGRPASKNAPPALLDLGWPLVWPHIIISYFRHGRDDTRAGSLSESIDRHQDQSVQLPRRLDRRRWLDWRCRKAAFAVPRVGAAGRAPHFTRGP